MANSQAFMEQKLNYTIFENAPIPVGICTNDGDFVYINNAFTQLFGYNKQDIPNIEAWFEKAYPFEPYREKVIATWEVDKRTSRETGRNQPAREYVITTKYSEIKTVETSFNIDAHTIFFYFNDVSRRKRAELKIRESEERFRQLFHLTFEGIFIHYKGVAIDMNNAFPKIFGYSRKELIGQNIIEIVGSKSLKPIFYTKNDESESGPYLGEAIKKDGKKIIIELEGRNVNYNGNYVRVTAVRDVTEKIRAEEELIKEKIFTEHVINVLPGVFFLYQIENDRYQIVRWNRNHEKYTGNKIQEIKEKNALHFIATEDHPRILEALKVVEKVGSHSIEASFLHESGRKTPFHFEAHQFNDGGKKYLLGMGFDITDQRRAEYEIRENQAQLNAIYNNAPVTLILMNNNLDIVKVNTNTFVSDRKKMQTPLKFGDLFSCLNAKGPGKECGKTVFCTNCHVRKVILNTFRKNMNANKVESEISVWGKEIPTTKTILISTVKLREIDHELVLITIDDITLRKEMERRMLDNEKKFRNIFDSSKNAIIITNSKNKIINYNQTAKKLFTDEKIRNQQDLANLFNADVKTIVANYLKKAIQNKATPPIELNRKNNDQFVLEISSKSIDYEGQKCVLNIIRDVTYKKVIKQKELQTIIQTEEKERSRIARELHDGIGPLLSTTKIYLNAINSDNYDERGKIAYDRLSLTIEEAIKSVQEISNNVSPHVLQNFGLEKALNSFISKLNGLTEMNFELNSTFHKRISPTVEVTLYRVLVELTNNSLKYSKAKLISIKLWAKGKKLWVHFSDDGIGFNLEKTLTSANGMGLSNVFSRIESIDGQIEMNSKPGMGVQVNIKLNLDNYE